LRLAFNHQNPKTSLETNRTINQSVASNHQHRASHAPHDTNRNTRRTKPEPDFVKANCDVSMKVKGYWGISAIIRNDEGMVMASATWRTLGFEDPTTAEASAIWKTMTLANECGFRQVIFEGDCERVIRLIQHKERQDRSYFSLFNREIQGTESAFDKCILRFTPRSGNRVADSLAHLAYTNPNLVWIEEVPPTINDVYIFYLIR